MIRHALPTVLSWLLLANCAHADWKYSRWGMTPDEVLAASNGKARSADPGRGRMGEVLPLGTGILAKSETKFSGVRFHVGFIFHKARLIQVQLSGRCSESESRRIEKQLRLKYGEPTKTGLTGLYRRYYWRRAGVDSVPGRWCGTEYEKPAARYQDCDIRYDCEEPECSRNPPTGFGHNDAPLCED
jgi:hypothetical protein